MSAALSISDASAEGLVTMQVGGQAFGVPVLRVQDVIAATPVDTVPLAPPEVAGLLNLRGRIVTAVDMRRRLGLPPREPGAPHTGVIVERAGELYALQVDDVGDVLWLPRAERQPCPAGVTPAWRALCDGLHRLPDELLLVLSVDQILTLTPAPLAA